MWHTVSVMMQMTGQTESCMQNQLSYYSLCVHICVCVHVCARLLDALPLFHVWPCRGPSQCSLCPCDASSVFNFCQSSGIIETLTKMLISVNIFKKPINSYLYFYSDSRQTEVC